MRALITAILLLPALAPAALADNVILMVNMNYSREELKALDEAAAKRGQALEVVPPREMVDIAEPMFKARDVLEAKIRQMHPDWSKIKMRAALSESMRKGSDYSGDPDLAPALGRYMDELQRRAREVSEAEKQYGSIYKQLSAKAEELRAAGHRVDSIAFSSHSDGSNLTGETSTRLSSSDIFHLKREHPELFQEPRHVLLLGCYNLTKMNGERWRYDLFPSATMLAGFGIRAPSRHNPLSSRFITDMLDKADELDQQMEEQDAPLDPAFLEKTFKSLRSFTNKAYPGVVDYCTTVLEGQPGTNKIDCAEQWDIFFSQANIIKNDYMDLQNLTKDPPANEDASDLRSFYTMLQNVCPAHDNPNLNEEEIAQYERYRTTMRESASRLIFWWNVQQNFQAYYERDLAELDGTLSALGIRSRIPRLDGSVGRVEFVRSYNALRDELEGKIDQAKRSSLSGSSGSRYGSYRSSSYQLESLGRAMEKMKVYDSLFYLEGEDSVGDGEKTSVERTLQLGGIPFNWIEGATVLESR